MCLCLVLEHQVSLAVEQILPHQITNLTLCCSSPLRAAAAIPASTMRAPSATIGQVLCIRLRMRTASSSIATVSIRSTTSTSTVTTASRYVPSQINKSHLSQGLWSRGREGVHSRCSTPASPSSTANILMFAARSSRALARREQESTKWQRYPYISRRTSSETNDFALVNNNSPHSGCRIATFDSLKLWVENSIAAGQLDKSMLEK